MAPRKCDAWKTASYERKIERGAVERDHQVIGGDGCFEVLQVDSVYEGLDDFSIIQANDRNFRPFLLVTGRFYVQIDRLLLEGIKNPPHLPRR